jgi:2,5-dihydroxypyridine 5,6-dioxygenase
MLSRDQDLAKSSAYLLRDILYLKTGQKLLLYTDEASDIVLTEALQNEAKRMGVHTDIVRLQTISELSGMIKALVNKIDNENYDVVCELSERYFYPSMVWKRAVQKGCRIYSLGGMDSASFIRCIGQVDYKRLYKFGLLLYKILNKSGDIKIITEAGTNLTCQLTSQSLIVKILARLKLMQRSILWRPDGKLKAKSSATFMAGQVAFQGIPGTIEGTVIIDGYLWPPDEIGQIDDPIVLKISKGRVISIEGCPSKSKILSKWLDGKQKGVEHFCIGFHPGARLSGKLLEAERTYGHIVIGIGGYPFHTDGIIKNPTLKLNTTVILQNGSFIHDKLAALENDLLQPYQDERIRN